MVWLTDTRIDRRWPDFSSRAAHLGVGSMLSLQLHVADDTIGALNLYARPGTVPTGARSLVAAPAKVLP
ncbi:hypothetical protein ACIA8K_17380 [Catenuloplanes sp. NPDC051500]|uniref:hypothetical protein n=1 Tax=Catenuloplanes sp. NPDC051500 TaxID=3363959 RepID=UPI0037AC0ABD